MKLYSSHQQENDRLRVTLMKAVAIVGVVIIHILSSWPGYIYTHFPQAHLYIFIDQLCRFSVPLFIGLSGYALARRYHQVNNWRQFFWRRISRLLPLYLIWTLGLGFIFRLIPSWYQVEPAFPWWEIVVLGKGDYHLYFVPLIFQLYALFPFLLWWLNRSRLSFISLTILVQVLVVGLYVTLSKTPDAGLFLTDQQKYINCLAWIGYFALGMFLAQWKGKFNNLQRLFVMIFWGICLYCTWRYADSQIVAGLDPLYGLQFTRLVLIPYGLLSILLALSIPWEKIHLPTWAAYSWQWLGEQSFVIYLCHTLLLRFIFAHSAPGITSSSLVFAASFFLISVLLSYLIERIPLAKN